MTLDQQVHSQELEIRKLKERVEILELNLAKLIIFLDHEGLQYSNTSKHFVRKGYITD